MRAGGNLGYTFSFSDGYFANASISAAFYHGHNVETNHQFKVEAVLGRYYKGFSFGLFGLAETYKQNQNNFTFGHGGYYSPQMAFLITPFVSYEHKSEKHYFKGGLAVGYYQDRLDSVKMYLKNTGGDTSTINDLYYAAERHKNLSGNIGFIYEYTMPNHFIIGTENRALQSSSDYREIISRVYLKKEF